MDISQLDTVSEDEGTSVHLEDARNEPMFDGDTPLTILVAGTYSARYREAERKETARAIRTNQKRRNALVNESDIEDLEDAVLRKQVACIIAWPFKAGDKAFPITLANWKALLSQQPQWQAQVQDAMQDHARFFPKN